jgi:hypothetical protein
MDSQAQCFVWGERAAALGVLRPALGAGEKGTIQVDSPPSHSTRPVGGRPSHVALMYLVEHWLRKKVVGLIKFFVDYKDYPILPGGEALNCYPIALRRPSKSSSAFPLRLSRFS